VIAPASAKPARDLRERRRDHRGYDGPSRHVSLPLRLSLRILWGCDE
jgi:hypothetical protein